MYVNAHRSFNLLSGQKSCTPCRKEISSYINVVQNEEPAPGPLHVSDMETDKSDDYEPFESFFADVSLVNESIGYLGESEQKLKS